MIYLIIGCEIGFWVLIAAGLWVRYGLGEKRLSAVLLALSPVVDLVLLVATAVDIAAGGKANSAHGLAALYIGLSVAHGHALIKWADQWAAYWMGSGPKPVRLYGHAHTVVSWKGFGRTVVGCAVAAALLGGLMWFAVKTGHPEALASFWQWFRTLGVIVVVDGIWAVSYSISPRRPPAKAAVSDQGGNRDQPEAAFALSQIKGKSAGSIVKEVWRERGRITP